MTADSGMMFHLKVATGYISRGPGRWVGIARQDCSYEPEPTSTSSVDDHAVSYRRLDDHLGCDTCLVCDSSNVRSAREFGSTPNLDAFASPNESRTICQLGSYTRSLA